MLNIHVIDTFKNGKVSSHSFRESIGQHLIVDERIIIRVEQKERALTFLTRLLKLLALLKNRLPDLLLKIRFYALFSGGRDCDDITPWKSHGIIVRYRNGKRYFIR